MCRSKTSPLLFLCFFLIFSCATYQPGYEQPAVTISSFETLPADGMLPRFKIGLHIVNPNRTPLALKGIAYTISLENHKILTGVSNKLPTIEAYGEADVALNASVDLFNSIRFFNMLIKNRKIDEINYSFDAKLDIGAIYPIIRVSRKGRLDLKNPSGQ